MEFRRGSFSSIPPEAEKDGSSEVKWLWKTTEMDAVNVKT